MYYFFIGTPPLFSLIFLINLIPYPISLGGVLGIVCFLIVFTIYTILILRVVHMILRNIIYDSDKLLFSYVLTLLVQENTPAIFLAIVFFLVGDKLNPFEGWIYYTCNILTFLLGIGFGVFEHNVLIEWMRKRTMWKGDWENYQNQLININKNRVL